MPTPSEDYTALFRDDPLLTLPESQKKYGAFVLSHLLDYRVSKSLKPHLINVFSRPDREFAFRPQQQAGGQPPSEMVEAYFGAVMRRRRLGPEYDNALGQFTMVADGTLTQLRRPGLREDGAMRNRPRIPKIDDVVVGDHCVRIAAIGHRVSISKMYGTGVAREDLCFVKKQDGGQVAVANPTGYAEKQGFEARLGRTVLREWDCLETWQNGIEQKIDRALYCGSHVVVLPEFALPPDRTQRQVKDLLKEICRKYAREDRSGFFIFAGSRHDGPFNRGLVLAGQMFDGGWEVARPLWHYKLASARSLGENVLGPGEGKLFHYDVQLRIKSHRREESFKVYLPICYDVFDPGVFMALVRQCSRQPNVIVLVPSFNSSPDFVALLRDLSFLGRCCVVYVNSLSGDSQAYICGVDVADLQSSRTRASMRARLKQVDVGTVSGRNASLLRHELNELRELLGRIDFSRVVTVEACPPCDRGADAEHRHDCLADVLYYTLDIRLLQAMRVFRDRFFGKETFLAEPLRFRATDEVNLA